MEVKHGKIKCLACNPHRCPMVIAFVRNGYRNVGKLVNRVGFPRYGYRQIDEKLRYEKEINTGNIF